MLWLLLLQVLASCLWLGHNEVVTSFTDCPQFFYEGSPPNKVLEPKNPAWICQRDNTSYRFATLYDREKRIPAYSAYIYQPGPGMVPDSVWFVEPQLINENSSTDIETETVLKEHDNFTPDQIKQSQAVDDDYRHLTCLDRGRLNPSVHQNSADSKTATFTLTNVVPMDSSLHNGQWNIYELITMSEKSQGCTTTYVITGAVPGDTTVAKGRVSKPSHIWSAACCLVGTQPRKAWGVIAENDKNHVDTLSLGELEKKLTDFYGERKVTLFNSACPRQ